MINYLKNYNIYYGTVGKKLGVKYRYTKSFKSQEEAEAYAYKEAESFYYKNEGTYGLPSFSDIKKEADYLDMPIEDLYKDHIKDMMRWYTIPSDMDTIPNKKLKW